MPSPTLFLRDFTVLDCALLDPAEGLLGESLHVSAELTGTLDEKGFLFDFGPAKKTLKKVVDEAMDHRLVVPSSLARYDAAKAELRFGAGLHYECPAEALVEVPGARVELAAMEEFLSAACRAALPGNISGVRISLREEPRLSQEPSFRYTHGLRLHDGNCQRLFHGHRNPVEVWRGGERSEADERWLAEEWRNVHFAHADTVENLAELDLPLGRRRPQHPGIARLAYRAPQGSFRGLVPAARLVLLTTEPSIENIARLAHETLRRRGISGPLRVVAYEGLNKGSAYSD